jgi:Flp pilus assembly protein TadG
MAALRRLGRRWLSDDGAEFVEFALAFPLLLLVVLGIMDFGLLFQQYEVITNAAREGARVGVLPNYTLTNAQTRAQSYVNAALISGGSSATVPMPTYQNISLGGGSSVCGINVQVTYPHQYLFVSGIAAYFGASFGTKTLTASSTMRLEGSIGPCP